MIDRTTLPKLMSPPRFELGTTGVLRFDKIVEWSYKTSTLNQAELRALNF
jgi:hypothetical protein